MNFPSIVSGAYQTIAFKHDGLTREKAREQIRSHISRNLELSLNSPLQISIPGGGKKPLITDKCGEVQKIFLSIAHEDFLSVAAFTRLGQIGIDLTKVKSSEDLDDISLLFLGPEVFNKLKKLKGLEKDQIFASEWSLHEARLKSLGLGLIEWSMALSHSLKAPFEMKLPLSSQYRGWIVLRPNDLNHPDLLS